MERKAKNAECKRKQLNYSCRNETNSRISETRNGRKKEVTTYYSDTSLATVSKSDEHQYCGKNAATLVATSFTLSSRSSYKLGGDNVVYTSKSDGSSLLSVFNWRETTRVSQARLLWIQKKLDY